MTITKLQEEVCCKFRITFTNEKWIPIKCIYHKDSHPSAGIIFKNGKGWYHCMGCKESKPISMLLDNEDKNMKYTSDYDDESYNEENNYKNDCESIDFKPSLNPFELLEKFTEEKAIGGDIVAKLDGYISNEGYLVFPYGLKNKRVGRYLGTDKNKPRFINEGGPKTLFGEEYIRYNDELFLVEGLTDYLSMYELGYINTVCSFGAELSEEQAYLLKGKTVFILYDKDYAGYSGALQASERIRKFKGIPIVLELYGIQDGPSKIDVNYLCKIDRIIFRHWLDQTIGKYGAYDYQYLETYRNKEKLKYYKSDISLLKFTEGLYVITGLPGVGKTTLGVSLIPHFVSQGAKVAYINYDLPKPQILSRIASIKSTHPFSEIEIDPSIIEDEVFKWLKELSKSVKVMNNLDINEINYSKKYYDCIIVDYLQRIPYTDSDSRLGIEKNLASLSEMASEDGKTVVCISRMPASAYGKTDGHLFSGSAAIEYNAQAAIVLNKNNETTVCCNVVKNTRGQTGTTFFSVDYEHQKIKETSLKQINKQLFPDRD